MHFSVHLHPPESSTNWERTQPSPGDVLRMETRRQYYAEYLHLELLMKLIAGDVELNPGPSASSSMGSVNNLYTEIRRKSSVTDVTGAITPTALACL